MSTWEERFRFRGQPVQRPCVESAAEGHCGRNGETMRKWEKDGMRGESL